MNGMVSFLCSDLRPSLGRGRAVADHADLVVGDAPTRSASRRSSELTARGDAELLEHLAQVVVDGVDADEQAGADLGVGPALGREPSDGGLPGGQVEVAFRLGRRPARRSPRARCGRAGRTGPPRPAPASSWRSGGARARLGVACDGAATRRRAGGPGRTRPRPRPRPGCRWPTGSASRPPASGAISARDRSATPRAQADPLASAIAVRVSTTGTASPGCPLRTAASTKSGYCSGVTCRNGSSIIGFSRWIGVAVVALRPGRARRARRPPRRAHRRNRAAASPRRSPPPGRGGHRSQARYAALTTCSAS